MIELVPTGSGVSPASEPSTGPATELSTRVVSALTIFGGSRKRKRLPPKMMTGALAKEIIEMNNTYRRTWTRAAHHGLDKPGSTTENNLRLLEVECKIRNKFTSLGCQGRGVRASEDCPVAATKMIEKIALSGAECYALALDANVQGDRGYLDSARRIKDWLAAICLLLGEETLLGEVVPAI